MDPALAEAHLNVGLVSQAVGDFVEAALRFRRSVELNPDWVTALTSLASVLAAAPDPNVRDTSEAVRVAERAVDLTSRRDANTLDVLAVAHAAAGDFGKAVTIIGEALALEPPPSTALVLRQHQALFTQQRPYVYGGPRP